MKKVSGYVYVRALGEYSFEFYVEDNSTEEEIKERVKKEIDYIIDYKVEDGYEKVLVPQYRKKSLTF